ncbi:hypothetical protein ACFRCQ_28055, partial [Cytobacillus firmus]|uniref:hypothetical protein n=1 Tax=Cytobacillus firmus TaxID=1399 RepID=UPI00368B4E59
MDLRKEPSFIHTDERMVLAECDNYYVAVVKLCQGRSKLPQNRRFKIPQKDFSVLLFLCSHLF